MANLIYYSTILISTIFIADAREKASVDHGDNLTRQQQVEYSNLLQQLDNNDVSDRKSAEQRFQETLRQKNACRGVRAFLEKAAKTPDLSAEQKYRINRLLDASALDYGQVGLKVLQKVVTSEQIRTLQSDADFINQYWTKERQKEYHTERFERNEKDVSVEKLNKMLFQPLEELGYRSLSGQPVFLTPVKGGYGVETVSLVKNGVTYRVEATDFDEYYISPQSHPIRVQLSEVLTPEQQCFMNVGVDKPEFEIPIAEMWNWHGDSPYTKFTLGGRTDVDPGFSALLASTLASVFPNSNEKEIRKTIYNATKVDPSRDIQATGKLDVDAILWVPARGKEIPDQRPIGDLF